MRKIFVLFVAVVLFCASGAIGQTTNKESAAFHEKGKTAYYNKDYNGAAIYFTKAIDLDPKNARAYMGRGCACNNAKKYPEAIADLTKSIELEPNPKTMDVYLIRGGVYNVLKKYPEAIADLTKVIELDPKNAAAYAGRGIAHSGAARYSEAVDEYTKAIELDPKNAHYYVTRGLSYKVLMKYSESVADCTKAIEIDPKNFLAYSVRSGANLGLGDLKKWRADEAMAKFLSK
jgi:tetratricopeptide (TPR) repeat protein